MTGWDNKTYRELAKYRDRLFKQLTKNKMDKFVGDLKILLRLERELTLRDENEEYLFD